MSSRCTSFSVFTPSQCWLVAAGLVWVRSMEFLTRPVFPPVVTGTWACVFPVGSEDWAEATALAFNQLIREACDEVAKPEWWNDEGLKALSAKVVRAAPDDGVAYQMRASVLSGACGAWEAGPRSAAELKEAATRYERAAALHPAPAMKDQLTSWADWCHRRARAEAIFS